MRHQGFFDTADGFGWVEAFGAGFDTVQDGMAAPDPVAVVQHFQAFVRAFVPGVHDEPPDVQQGGRSQVFGIGPEAGAGRRAGRADLWR